MEHHSISTVSSYRNPLVLHTFLAPIARSGLPGLLGMLMMRSNYKPGWFYSPVVSLGQHAGRSGLVSLLF